MESVRLLHTFVREAEDLLDALDQGLLELESAGDPDVVDRLFRAAHTLKGNAGMVGFSEAVRLTHVLENVLDRLRSRSLAAGPEVISALFSGVDVLRKMTARFSSNQPPLASEEQEVALTALSLLTGESEEDAPGTERLLDVRLYLRKESWTQGEDLASLLDELALIGELVEVETLFDRVPELTKENALDCSLGLHVRLKTTSGPMAVMGICFLSVEEEDLTITDITSTPKVFSLAQAASEKETSRRAVAPPADLAPLSVGESKKSPSRKSQAAPPPQAHKPQSTLRVETEKLDRLMDLVGELVIGISQVREQGGGSQASQMAVERLEALGRDLQDQVMTLRMLPIQDTFERFRRPIRDLAKDLGKSLELKITGGDTQVDKRVIDNLVDPLKHMLRNCVSHGLETGQERLLRGKPEAGTIFLSASQREGHVVIEITDDGRGIDPVRVREKAEERGLLSRTQELTEAQVFDLIFLPGFSTAAEVSEISGRGVGLDVVRKNIQALRGSIEIQSKVGEGTTFRIRLPVTLAIVDGMNVVVGDETVTIPLQSVVELIAVENHTVQRMESIHEYIDVRGELVPMLRLGEVLRFPETTTPVNDQRIVLVETERRKFGLLVDRVLGMSQTVIKPLDRSYRLVECMEYDFTKPKSIGGAAILGDGNVGIILDIHGIESAAFEAA